MRSASWARLARAGVAERQTRQTQNLLSERTWEFKSPRPHQENRSPSMSRSIWAATAAAASGRWILPGRSRRRRICRLPAAGLSRLGAASADADYGRNLDRDGNPVKAFEPSLFVWATVMSCPTEDRAIVDAGLKALAFDSGPPLVCDEPAATYERASDEHGRLGISGATNRLRHRRQGAPHPRPLRPDRQPLRLVCLRPRQPRRAALADHRERCGVLIFGAAGILETGMFRTYRRVTWVTDLSG